MSVQSELDDLLAVISATAAPRAQASAEAARSRTVDALSLAEEEDPVVLDLVEMAEMAEMAQAAAALERSRNLSAAHARRRKSELRLEAKLEAEKRARQRAEARLQLAFSQISLKGHQAPRTPSVIDSGVTWRIDCLGDINLKMRK